MDNYTFKLKRPMVLPSPQISGALLLFMPDRFSLSYEMIPRPKEETMVVNLNIVEAATGNNALQINSFTITEQGFPTGQILNEAEIAAWVLADTETRAEIAEVTTNLLEKQGEEYALIQAKEEVPKELTEAIVALSAQLGELQAELVSIGEKPLPVLEYFNRYSEVLQYFDNKGAITPEGIAWARQIPFLGFTIGDFIL